MTYVVVAQFQRDEEVVSIHNTERQAWIACNRSRRDTAAIWGHKLYGPSHHVRASDGSFIAMHDLDKRWRR